MNKERSKGRAPKSETEKKFCEILQMADPLIDQFVSEHEAYRQLNEALRERVTVLERALETIADPDWASIYPPDVFKETKRVAQKALDA